MTTPQDQQSRAEFVALADSLGYDTTDLGHGFCHATTRKVFKVWQAARALPATSSVSDAGSGALPAGVEPVGSVYTIFALVPGGREMAHVTLHKHLPAGTKLYTAAQVLAIGRVPPGFVAVPTEDIPVGNDGTPSYLAQMFGPGPAPRPPAAQEGA